MIGFFPQNYSNSDFKNVSFYKSAWPLNWRYVIMTESEHPIPLAKFLSVIIVKAPNWSTGRKWLRIRGGQSFIGMSSRYNCAWPRILISLFSPFSSLHPEHSAWLAGKLRTDCGWLRSDRVFGSYWKGSFGIQPKGIGNQTLEGNDWKSKETHCTLACFKGDF